MDDRVLVSIIAGVSAVIGGLLTAVIGPSIKHWLEQRTRKNELRRAQVAQWRAMVLEVANSTAHTDTVGEYLQVHSDFMSLEPHLLPEVRNAVYKSHRTFVVGHALPAPLQAVKDDIARIEKAWGVS